MKLCSKCNVQKSFEYFYVSLRSKDGLQSRCKNCNGKSATEWSRQNYTPEAGRIKYLKKYGMTPEKYQNLFEKQNSACKTCGRVGLDLKIDHCHTGGQVRGLLCNGCNTALGLVKESRETLLNLIKYLENSG